MMNGPADEIDAPKPAAPHAAADGTAPPAATEGDVAQPPATPTPIIDVWSRTEPRYRIRAVVLLALNFLLYCGLCVFTFWLHSARLFDFSTASYFRPFRFWGPQTQNLNDFLLEPISVVATPIHGVVLGLLVASIVAVPIAVAMLYRFPAALPFAAAVAIVAHLPWMAVTLVGACVLAAVPPFRFRFRFGSALLALLPVLLYLYLATRVSPGQVAAYSAPEERTLLFAPWILAILAAALILGLVLLLSWVVNYRPGAVAPVLAGALTLPTLIFHNHVGTDELAYRVIESRFGPHSTAFQPVRDIESELVALVQQYNLRADDLLRALTEGLGEFRRRAERHYAIELLECRQAANAACERFIAEHPRSRYISCVLYVQARALDTRLDESALLPLGAAGSPPLRELYTDFPHPQSERAWSVIAAQYPESPQAVVAAVRLAQLHLRRGEVEQALLRLLAALNREPPHAAPPTPTSQPSLRTMLRAAPPEASLDLEVQPYLLEVQHLHRIVTLNRNDPKYGDAPLGAVFTLDRRRAGYRDQLLMLMDQYPDSFMYDNLLVAWAVSTPDIDERAEHLRGCLARFPTGAKVLDAARDALPEALYRLAGLEIQALRDPDGAAQERGINRLRDIISHHERTIWATWAAEDLQRLQPPPAEAQEPS